MNPLIEKWGPLFVLFNALGIVSFALAAVIWPQAFWEFLQVQAIHFELARIMAWYLLVFGIGGLLVWRNPRRHAIVVLLIGLEKIAPALLFPMLYFQQAAHWLVLAVGLFDGSMALLCICYSAYLCKPVFNEPVANEFRR